LQAISQKILTNKQWIDAIYSAIKDSIQVGSKGISGKIKSKERTINDLRQKVDHLIDQVEDESPIPELRLRLEKRTEELRQAELQFAIKKISEKVGISIRYTSQLLKEDYQFRGEKIPDFRGSNHSISVQNLNQPELKIGIFIINITNDT
jgi:hypothetical protein